ncbi:MAG: tetratricopeptide repeat protein [Candidatus Micrarchaeota archaeon]|nr:tetratricopeptide repeat protein [Candidatus Micrarchaeota archaeon]
MKNLVRQLDSDRGRKDAGNWPGRTKAAGGRPRFESARIKAFTAAARADLSKGEPAKAIKEINRALSRDSQNFDAWWTKGLAEMKRNKHPDARISLQTALGIARQERNLAPETLAKLHADLGKACCMERRHKAALEHYQKSLRLWAEARGDSDADLRARYYLCGTYKRMGILYVSWGRQDNDAQKFRIGIEHLDKAVELGSRTPATYLARGICRQELGQYREAIADFGQSLELDPDQPDVLGHLKSCYFHLDMMKEASRLPIRTNEPPHERH